MKQPVQPHDPRDVTRPDVTRPVPDIPQCTALGDLTDIEKQVLECLGGAAQGLTARQLESALSCDAEEMAGVLESLREKGVVHRLNTVIPSYASRYPGIRLHGE